jgi:hypothetical protein
MWYNSPANQGVNMAKVKEIIGEYAVPGGKGGAAVAKACQLVLQNPGIKQGDVHEQAAHWAGLNHSTANWISSPGPKSPAELLWGRRKEGRGFRCYPNEHTDKLGDPRIRIRAEVLKDFERDWKQSGRPIPGELVRCKGYDGTTQLGLLIGFSLFRGQWVAGGFVTSREALDDISNFDLGFCSIHTEVIVGEHQKFVTFNWLSKE